ncbi:zinc finger CCCH domain-containing protein 50-like [Phragmites australis]|uniref:zinc finger CCCH domain-containing protein 50-like n=1 Tax=Phragmites australis TaxID=29695 RepID=UPI002D782C11|nr:zinc finger CCCH domain-containing protein 50-like [Phragmites australis]XP_062187165.1 zinc finger CCCH domain-containing protein 50-like [Phragmites australis]
MGDLADLACAAEAARSHQAGGSRRDRLAALLELAAADDAAGFREALAGGGDEEAAELADGVGLWYGRSKAYEPRTPLMVAATYGSATVVSLLLGLGCVDVNRRPGVDGATALHCAASGGSRNAVAIVKSLLAAGADLVTPDSAGRFPADVILAPPGLPDSWGDLEMLLGRRRGLAVATSVPSGSSSPPLSSSPDEGNRSPSSRSSSLSPITVDRGKKEYPVDPTLPDIKSSVYASDEFRMFAFKVRPCSRAYSHDWTECPFVHPGENARRRDPRKHPYTAVPCPNFRRPGGCPSGDSCEFSHGVFESWLHPSQYRTRLCKESAACARRICFFAHDEDELRHVPHNSSAGLLSPRASSSIDMTAAAALGLLPGSPTRHFVPPPVSPSSANYGGGAAAHWLQGSRLRSSFNARDAQVDDLGALLEWESQYLGALSLPQSSRSQTRLSTGLSIRPTAIVPTSLEEMYASDMAMSPRFTNDQGQSVYSPAHKSAILNKLHQQKGLLSPVNTNRMYSPRGIDPSALIHSPFGAMSPRSPRTMEPTSPLSARVGPTVTQREMFDQFSSLNKHQVPSVGSPRNLNASWGNIGAQKSKVDWGVDDEELVRLRHPAQSRVAEEEPDVSWVQSLVNHADLNGKRGEMAGMASRFMNRPDLSNQAELLDETVIASWLEHMHLEPK